MYTGLFYRFLLRKEGRGFLGIAKKEALLGLYRGDASSSCHLMIFYFFEQACRVLRMTGGRVDE